MKTLYLFFTAVLALAGGAAIGSYVTAHNMQFRADTAAAEERMTDEAVFVKMAQLGFLRWERMCAYQLGWDHASPETMHKSCSVDFKLKDVFGRPVR